VQALAIPLLLSVGALLALQAAANVQLSAAMASPSGASTLQLAIAAALLLGLAAVAGSLDGFALIDEAEPWELVGGLGSAIYITAGILLFPRLGALVAVGLFIAGQMAASLVLDGFGWIGVAHDPPGAVAVAGAAAVASGVWLIVHAQAGPGMARPRVRWIVLGLAAGAVLPVQGAVNAQLNTELHAAFAVGTISFAVATGSMALAVLAATRAGAPRPQVTALATLPWWGWLGGVCGATYVTSVFLLIPEIGAAPVVVLTVAGQQLASIAVDRHGLFRLPRRPVTRRRLAGVALLLPGVALITLG
jgi:transporter family-2 protein